MRLKPDPDSDQLDAVFFALASEPRLEDDARSAFLHLPHPSGIAKTLRLERGERAWKGLYSIVSILGFALLIYGYGLARQAPVVLSELISVADVMQALK